MERQMTIDDFLNKDNIETLEAPAKEVEALEVEPADMNTLSKEELIGVLENHVQANKHLLDEIEQLKNRNEEEVKRLSEYYGKRIKELLNINKYYERKLKLLKDLITIEVGGEE